MTDTKTTHTPGPWTVDPEDGCINSELGWIAQVVGWNNQDDETQPNARLIAAAPDLLEACSRLLTIVEREGIENVYVTEARAAVAKAEGGAA